MGDKKAFKGFSGLRIALVTKNSATEYATNTQIPMTGAQSFTMSPEVSEWKIPGDDGIFDSGADWNGAKFTLTLAHMPLEWKPNFEGGTYNSTTKEYDYGSDSQAPEIAIGFKVLLSGGGWRMVKLWSCKCSSLKEDFKTKGESGDISPVTIEGLIQNRALDNKAKREKEAAVEADLTWLDSFATA